MTHSPYEAFEPALAQTYRRVYTNYASRVLLVHTGFAACAALEDDYKVVAAALPNGWKPRLGKGPFGRMVTPKSGKAQDFVTGTVNETLFVRPGADPRWLEYLVDANNTGEDKGHTVMVVNLADVPVEMVLAGLTGMAVEFCRVNRNAVLKMAAQQLSNYGRTKLRSTVFLLPSEDLAFLEAFKAAIDTDYREMSQVVVAG